MNKRLIPAVLAIFVVSALTATLMLSQPIALAADTPVTTQPDPAQFARGAQIWANTCGRCHNMRDPRELRDDQWRAAMAHMRVRAGLTGQETRDVLIFLQGSN